MPSFSDSFWTTGYSGGLNILFDKLHQGCVENDEVLALAAARAEAEEQYGIKLRDLPYNYTPKKNGFGRDDGASLRKAYEGIVTEMGEEGAKHIQVAENIRRMVLTPFGKWSDEHRQRVEYSHSVLKNRLRAYEKELTEVQKSQKKYFNKCRVLEDFKESEVAGESYEPPVSTNSTPAVDTPNVGTFAGQQQQQQLPTDPNKEAAAVAAAVAIDEQNATMGGGGEDPVELGGEMYSPEEARNLFRRMLEEIPQKDVKVPILGTYEHVSTGDQIVSWALKNIAQESLAKAEQFGQVLITAGFLRLVGQVGSKFANSSVMNYQWRKQAFVQAGKEAPESGASSFVGGYLGDTINNYINNPHPDETMEERLVREVKELDQKYKVSIQKLDDIRCHLEESIIDHLKFMEICELDRLKAVKAVFLDFVAALSNVVPSIQSAVDKELLYQETVHPANDLRYALESYRTGPFSPKVTVYDNYYNSTEEQTFGVDLELRCRGDKKRVPFVVSAVLSHMDSQYPILENDEVRLGVWTVSVPLKSTHALRKEINTGKQFQKQILQGYEAPIVASVLKLYLVELPDSLVPSQFYDIIKAIYSQHGNDDDPRARISALQNTFAQLRLTNIATLDAIMTHLTRLTSIANAPTEYILQLAQEFSSCVLRPRAQSSLTIGDRHAFRLVHDLLTYKEQIFKELKRNNSAGSNKPSRVPSVDSASVSRRPTLQNRLDALSLKIRQGQKSLPSSPVPSQDSPEAQSEEQSEYEQVKQENEEPSTETTAESHHSAARHNQSLTDPEAVKAATAAAQPEQEEGEHTNPIVID
ncbi:rho-GTPase-activating protein Rgd2p [Trichomonascus vanleenenianus]|uniref:rho-GTPase-activating protein Rgd2p n=1 Tax=Trichomonascus vanleenenianus TaxID=2268995 RepID=UPI003EC982DD